VRVWGHVLGLHVGDAAERESEEVEARAGAVELNLDEGAQLGVGGQLAGVDVGSQLGELGLQVVGHCQPLRHAAGCRLTSPLNFFIQPLHIH
jgi:hypothetical protein